MTPFLEAWLLPALFLTVVLAGALRPGGDVTMMPPSLASLKERLDKRGQDTPDVIARRIEAAREEMRHCGEFDYVIMNQDFARAVDDLSVIVRAARLAAPRQQVRHGALIAELMHP